VFPCALSVSPALAARSSEALRGDPGADIHAADVLADIRYLASDALEGRMTGEPGAEKAMRYIAAQFRRAGLTPAGDGGTYLQHFEATTGVHLGDGNSLRIAIGDERLAQDSSFAVNEDFIPFAFSDTGSVQAPVVFAGYGITAPELHYDDYAGVDVHGAVVLLLRHEPRERDSTSVFDGRRLTQYADFRFKLMTARNHGALGALIVTDPLNHSGEEDDLVSLQSAEGFGGGAVPAVHMRRRIAEWMLHASGQSLADLQALIDSTTTPHSTALRNVTATLHVALVKDRRSVANVAGVLRGSNPARAGEYVAVGAHYDHLGRGGANSLAHDDERHAIHHGADDNASGTAGVLALARSFAHAARHGARLERSLLFLCFTGEEEGLLGSGYYVNHPAVPIESTVTMINMDMVGRMRNNKLTVSGLGTSPEFRSVVDSAAKELGLTLGYGESGYGPSDHTSFYSKNVPVLFLFTGVHTDYHRPTDTVDKINAPGEVAALRLAARTMRHLADQPGAIVFTRAAADTGAGRMSEGAGSSGYGAAYLGTIPDFEEFEGGVKLTGVREGSPAEKAGIRGGDIIVAFAGKPIKNLYDYTYALRAQKPGDVVEIEIVRNGEHVKLTATLGKRKSG
jgi:hypothetical protein